MFANITDYQIAFIKLVSYMQNIGDLSTDENLYDELAFICDCDAEVIAETIDY